MTLPKPKNSVGQFLKDWSGVIALAPVLGALLLFCVQLWQMPARIDRLEKKQDLMFRDLHLIANAIGHPLPDDSRAYGDDGYPEKPNVKTLTQNQKDASLD